MFSFSSVLVFTAAVSAYVPSEAEWATPVSARSVLVQDRSDDNIARRADVPSTEINSVEQLIYDINVTIGNQDVNLLLDSGSFSLWTATPDYVCSDIATNYTQSHCGIVGSYEPAKDPDAIAFPDARYDESYGSGWASGSAYNTTVTVAGLEVENYSIGYADYLDFDAGDELASGIIGLGIGTATGFWYRDVTRGTLAPVGFFERLKDKLSAWQFAITFGQGVSNGATDRSNTGLLSFGGIDPAMGTFSSSDFVTLNVSAADIQKGYSYWGGIIDGFTYTNSAWPLTSYDVLVDSGTAYMLVSPATFDDYNSMWTPNATFVSFSGTQYPGYYYIDCDATAPDFSIVIGGQYVNISSSDLIYRTVNGTCRSSIVQGYNTPKNILGTPLFKSNLVVFDGDAMAMHIAPKPRK